MCAKLVQSEFIDGWFVDLWNDGTMDVWEFYAWGSGEGASCAPHYHKLYPNMGLGDSHGIPECVRHVVYEVRNLHRSTQRLSLSYRRGTFGSRGLWGVNALSKRFQAFYTVTC